ncbi:hypothetical protein NZD89_02315 [Alicyclobacillus fastidiosus]|uniref:Nucleotidyltransferase n=1 Tax=Alicyclobacillus fastidiosus TaxID=392011 RepID=A0ABY6ZIF7_9BACL|nr:hypothetical protein [Alicyclobacillus fastidiosus]WAH42363.1 hypothetical protein NZD89_02315 [Alicyclobacillus fastidiosus]GMA64172.1 hypothetical protein GCM10025859_46120 [Alicyclobacillus fastidiosus]
MLTITNTPNLTGLSISGDYIDLDTLYMALFMIVGDEGEYGDYEGARLRVLGVMYDIRHAFQGEREFEFVRNGMDEDRMKLLEMITPEKNLYYKCQVYYPEALFVTMAINDFIRLYAKKQAKSAPFPLVDKKNLWDAHIATARLFQSLIANCLKEIVTEASFKRIMNLLNKDYTWTDGYTTQYLDLLNIRYLNFEDKEERAKALSTIVKRMVEKGKEYQEIERDVREMAIANNCSTEDISLSWDYPEQIEW